MSACFVMICDNDGEEHKASHPESGLPFFFTDEEAQYWAKRINALDGSQTNLNAYVTRPAHVAVCFNVQGWTPTN